MAENPQIKTKTLILDAAERLFAEQGIGHTSLRQVIAEAKVNIAAVHYHFGSKEQLIYAVLERRIIPINEERFKMLDAIEAAAGEGPLPLEPIIEAFIRPPFRLRSNPAANHGSFVRVMGRCMNEPNETVQAAFGRLFGEVIKRFMAAYLRALPELPPEEIMWRAHFGAGTMAHAMCGGEMLKKVSQGRLDIGNGEAVLQRLVAFIAAGMRAPMLGADEPVKTKEGKKA